MIEITDEQMVRIRDLCDTYGVVKLELFGSAATDAFDPARSDLDMIGTFGDPEERGYARRYLRFAEALEALFGRRVDLMTDWPIRNPFLRRSVDQTRRTLHERPRRQTAA